jgi:hypothetical protein
LSNLEKLIELSFAELGMLGLSVLMLPVVSVLLKLRGFQRTERLMAWFSRSGTGQAASHARVSQAARMVSIAAFRGPLKSQCLEQAITLWWMLGVMGISSTIRFGIYKSGNSVEAHAWLLHDDNIVIGQMDTLKEYTPLLDVNIERQR